MAFSLPTLLRAAFGQPPKLTCSRRVWDEGVQELHRRTGGHRESGAFLVGENRERTRIVRRFFYYDDFDPSCFANGIVEFDGRHFGAVWQACKSLNLTVIADVHVHPGGYGQSKSDRHNPMIPEVGHLALILPRYAVGECRPGNVGIYEYLGARQWRDHSHRGSEFFHLGWWPR